MKVSGARVVITGAGSGIGRATALRCARQGAEVVAVDIDGEAAAATAQQCGPAAAPYATDVADAAAVADLAERVESERGPVDVLVNNAGVGLVGPFLDASPEDWDWIRGVNLDGVAYGCHVFGARMVARRRGHVVNVASGSGYVAHRTLSAYCATKAGVIMLSQCLRADWRSSGVGVSVVCPGVIATPIARHSRMVGEMTGRRENAVKLIGRGRSPDAVAKAIVGAVERNQALVPVGIESALAFRLLRVAPESLQSLLARARVV